MRAGRLLLALVAAAVGTGPVRAQEPGPPVIPASGTEVFCWLLKGHGFTALQSVDELNHFPAEQTLAIVFGRAGRHHEVLDSTGNLRHFQKRGGAVLLASDYARPLPEWGLRIPSAVVHQVPGFAYRDETSCPLLPRLSPAAPPGFQPPPQLIATNRPSYFAIDDRPRAAALHVLADFRRDCEPGSLWTQGPNRADGAFQLAASPLPYILLADAGKPAEGRAILIAGHGLFTNAMLLQKDNNNFHFADDCVRWLRPGPGKKARVHALFIVDGEVVPSFDTILKPPLPPVPTPTIQLVNRLLAGMEREGFLFRVLHELFNAPATAGVSLVVLTIALLCYGATALAGQRHRAEAGALLTTGPFALVPIADTLVQQRIRSQIARSAFGDEARALARAWFQARAGVAPADWECTPAPSPPESAAAGGWWQRRRLGRLIAELSALAGGQAPTTVAPAELVRLTARLHALTKAVHTGQLRFTNRAAARKP